MKKIMYFAFSLLLLAGSVNVAKAADGKDEKALTTEQQMKLDQISQRVEEIKNMDKSNLTREQKKDLKKEVTTMQKEAKAISNGGIYLSLTALLVIIIILLLL